MATYFSILVWRIPWIEQPGGLQSMGLQRIRHDLTTITNPQVVVLAEILEHKPVPCSRMNKVQPLS